VRVEGRRAAPARRVHVAPHSSMRPVDDSDLTRLRRELPASEASAYLKRRHVRGRCPVAPSPRSRTSSGNDALARPHRIELLRALRRAHGCGSHGLRRCALERSPSASRLTHSTTGAVNLALGRSRLERRRRDRHDRCRASGSRRAARRARSPARRHRSTAHPFSVRAIPLRRSRRLIGPRTRAGGRLSHNPLGHGPDPPRSSALGRAARAQRGLAAGRWRAEATGAIEGRSGGTRGSTCTRRSGQKWVCGPSGTGGAVGARGSRVGARTGSARLPEPRPARRRGQAALAGSASLRRRVPADPRACAAWPESVRFRPSRRGLAGGRASSIAATMGRALARGARRAASRRARQAGRATGDPRDLLGRGRRREGRQPGPRAARGASHATSNSPGACAFSRVGFLDERGRSRAAGRGDPLALRL